MHILILPLSLHHGFLLNLNYILSKTVALFGMTAKEWREKNPGKTGNMRDDATLNQLLVLSNMESYNAILIEQGKPQSERLKLRIMKNSYARVIPQKRS